MQGYGRIQYADAVEQFRNAGWELVSQTTDETVFRKRRGVNGILAGVLMIFLPIVGLFIVMGWIAASGFAEVVVERDRVQGRIIGRTIAAQASSHEEMDFLLEQTRYARNMGYNTAVLVGVISSFLILFIASQLFF